MKIAMTLKHAVLWIDHHHASVHSTGEQATPVRHVKAHAHPTAQHGSEVRSEHELFGEVCDALEAVEAALVAGSKTALADFRHYVEKHRPQTGRHIASYQTVEHLSDRQLVALGRDFFDRP